MNKYLYKYRRVLWGILLLFCYSWSTFGQVIVDSCPSGTASLVTHSSGTPPSGTTVTWHTGSTATSANKVLNPASVGPGTYYAAYFDATNNCYSPTSQPVYVAVCAQNACSATTVDLTTHSTSTAPNGTTITWHTGTPATASNKVSNPSSVGAGTYYAAYFDATNNCYSPTSTPVKVTINNCNTTDTDGDGIADSIDLDDDNDGILDTVEISASCTGITGSTTSNSDCDGDGVPNSLDLDSDNDGINDVIEAHGTDTNGDGMADGAVNSAGIASTAGNGLTPPNTDGTGGSDPYDLDSDNDGTSDLAEGGISSSLDANGDGRVDCVSNCDPDGDGILTPVDGLPNTRGDATDTDGDGIADSIDLDDDNDGILDTVEISASCTGITGSTTSNSDCDGDGVPNSLDLDSDNDGINDVIEAHGTDTNGDGMADGAVNSAGIASTAGNGLTPPNTDGTGGSDPYDLDSDNDGTSDLAEGGISSSLDANGDGRVDCVSNCDPDGDGILTPVDGLPNTRGDATANAKLGVKVLLQGALFGTTGTIMRDDLRATGVIPNTQPYTNLGATYPRLNHTGNEVVGAGVLNVTGNDAIVDWVLVELRDATNPTVIMVTKAALVQRDGDVVEAIDGVSPLSFIGEAGKSYYVAIKHRNHLGVMTANAISMTSTVTTIDFTTMSSTQLYNSASYDGYEQVDVNGKKALWAGNANANTKVKYTGSGNDQSLILNQVLTYPANSAQTYNYDLATPVYSLGDINMDAKVKYRGSGNDANFILNNVINLYVGLNIAKAYNYDLFLEQIP
ncbi:hypothetical protein [Emticicia sp. 17c]|uniref:hypothetical protein n=1 Tax=Emticicia sp. 17c TaxID=3127704 RepID=UPI00301CED71